MEKFTRWARWSDRKKLANQKYPGVYAIAYNESCLEKKRFSMIKSIVYFGMSNNKNGIRARLSQFDRTIRGKTGHGGAKRFRGASNYPKYLEEFELYIDKLYVAICTFEADPNEQTPKDLKQMGKVAEFEYICFAKYKKKYGDLPKFNQCQSLKA